MMTGCAEKRANYNARNVNYSRRRRRRRWLSSDVSVYIWPIVRPEIGAFNVNRQPGMTDYRNSDLVQMQADRPTE